MWTLGSPSICISITSCSRKSSAILQPPSLPCGWKMSLSVLSALARLDVDAWQEADDLAQLPGETAIQRLASLIAALPDGPAAHRNAGAIAARLIALLPRRDSSKIAPRETFIGINAVSDPRGFVYAIAIFVALVLGAQYVIAHHQPPTQVDDAPGPASSTFFPQTPPPNSGQ
jgi:hypothetical protein